ncbi:PIG-L deacetylase family protein [Halomicrobium mukohataei]|uniref:PIG-L deacetylase family protein n=1 Tax=Halomicrobium mukohataei TaxID=57705 RepID=UPI001CB99F18|nr:PIG-L deacetylase family protein [Halomicrobium mukohataei]
MLVIGAHPDDEVLGAGGAMAKHAAAGDEVHVLIVTEGTTQQYGDDEDLIEEKQTDARTCAETLGVSAIHFGGLPDMRLDEVAHVDVNAAIEDACAEIGPDIVYTHSRREVNRDHVEIHDSTLVATRPGTDVSTVLAYETPSSTDFAPGTDGFDPDLFVDIEEHLETKIEAFGSYEIEKRPFPHPRSPEALEAIARSRGAASGVPAAEAFDVLRAYR